MHLKVLLKLNKNSLLGKYMKNPKTQKKQKNKKKPPKNHWADFFFKTGFFQPCLLAHHQHADFHPFVLEFLLCGDAHSHRSVKKQKIMVKKIQQK
jgi:hypothetical protein